MDDGEANDARDALTVLPLALPQLLALRFWGSLPCDVRLRCREVCRAWCDALADARAWTTLDVSRTSGVVARVTPALLLAVAARARGQLERLYLNPLFEVETRDKELHTACLTLLAQNSDTLKVLRLERPLRDSSDYNMFQALCRAAPRRCMLDADLTMRANLLVRGHKACTPLLRNEPPFQAVRVRHLTLHATGMLAADVPALASDLAAHTLLNELVIYGGPLNDFASLDAVVDAALALRLSMLQIHSGRIGPETAVALARLLRSDTLLTLHLSNCQVPLLDEHVAGMLADALRSNRTLKTLALMQVNMWHDTDAAAVLFDALVGHASLQSISLSCNRTDFDTAAAAGALLGALVAAVSPLTWLDVSLNRLGDAGMGPLVDALPRTTRLRQLLCFDKNGNEMMSAAFAQDRLMPALAANTSLRMLKSGHAEADAFVAARTAAAAAHV